MKYTLSLLLIAGILLLGGCSYLFPANPTILPSPDRPTDPLKARLQEVYPEGYQLIPQREGDILQLDLDGDGKNQNLAAFVSHVQGHIGVAVEVSPEEYELIGFSMDHDESSLQVEILEMWDAGRQQFSMTIHRPEGRPSRFLVYDYRDGRLQRVLSTEVSMAQSIQMTAGSPSQLVLLLSGAQEEPILKIYRPQDQDLVQADQFSLPAGLSYQLEPIAVGDTQKGLSVKGVDEGTVLFYDVLVPGPDGLNWVMEQARIRYQDEQGSSYPLTPAVIDGSGLVAFPFLLEEVNDPSGKTLRQVQWSRWQEPGILVPLEQTLEIPFAGGLIRYRIPQRWEGKLRIDPALETGEKITASYDLFLIEDAEEAHLFTLAILEGQELDLDGTGLTEVVSADRLLVGVRVIRGKATSVYEGFEILTDAS